MSSKKRHPLKEVAEKSGLPLEIIVRFISFKWITPDDEAEEFLDEEDIARARLIWQLQQDMGVNDAAVPIILHLIDQINRTHWEVKKRQSSE